MFSRDYEGIPQQSENVNVYRTISSHIMSFSCCFIEQVYITL